MSLLKKKESNTQSEISKQAKKVAIESMTNPTPSYLKPKPNTCSINSENNYQLANEESEPSL